MQLKIHERTKIYEFRKQGLSSRKIGLQLGRDSSIIRRELQRNSDSIGYLFPRDAQEKTDQRKANHGLKVNRNEELREFVIEKSKERWSPNVIAGSWSKDRPDQRISKGAIYNFIYADENKHLKLWEYLARKKKKRGIKRKARFKVTIKERVSIHERPKHIETREEFGHFEADLFFNLGSQSQNVISLIERKSRMITLIKNESKISDSTIDKISRSIQFFAKTITYDNGKEFAHHYKLNRKNIKTYFCDPASPWQKGSVENVHTIIRRFIPFSMPYYQITQKMLDECAHKINNIPRQILDFQSPIQVFHQNLNIMKSRMKPALPAVEARL